jgi:hypothetical protein
MTSSSSSQARRVYISTKDALFDSRDLKLEDNGPDIASALFRALYNEGKETVKLLASEYVLTGPAFGRVLRDGRTHIVPIAECNRLADPPNSRILWGLKNNSQYFQRLDDLKANYGDTGIFVDQRAFGVTTAESKHRLICTFGVMPCVVVLLYDRESRVAALSHFDEAQDYTSINDMIEDAGFRGKVVDVHFYGGCTDDDAADKLGASCNTSTEALRALLNASIEFDVKLVICSFNVLNKTHGDGITFDAKNGAFYGYGTPALLKVPPADPKLAKDASKKRDGMVQPLDSRFRMWPNGEYLASTDGQKKRDKQVRLEAEDMEAKASGFPGDTLSPAAILCGQLIGIIPVEALSRREVINRAKRAQCVWNASPKNRAVFVNGVSELVSQMVIWQAVSTNEKMAQAFGGPVDGLGHKSLRAMVDYLNALKKPMAMEDSLKRWLKGRELLEDPKITEANAKYARELLENTIVGVILGKLAGRGYMVMQPSSDGSSSSGSKANQGPSPDEVVKAIRTEVEAWVKTNVHPWEAEMQ